MSLADLLQRILRQPSPDDLWALQPVLLAFDSPNAEAAREIAHRFYVYASQVESKLNSKRYSTVSARLAAGSWASSPPRFSRSLLSQHRGALGELLAGGLAGMLGSARQPPKCESLEDRVRVGPRRSGLGSLRGPVAAVCDTQPGLSPTNASG